VFVGALPLASSLACRQADARILALIVNPVMIDLNCRVGPNPAALKAAAKKGEIGVAELLSITSPS